MEQSLCPVSIKTGGVSVKEPPKVDADLFQTLIPLIMAGVEKEENPEIATSLEGKGQETEMMDFPEEAEGEAVHDLGHLIQGLMVKAAVPTNETDGVSKGESLKDEGPVTTEAGKENFLQGNIMQEKAVLEKAMQAMEANMEEELGETIPLQFKAALGESFIKQGPEEKEKILNPLHQEGLKPSEEPAIKEAPKVQVTEQVLVKNLETLETEVIKSFETTKEGETSLVKIKLEPESLGKVDIQLRMEDGKLKGSIIVENNRIRELFGDRLVELGTRLNQQNIPMDELKVEVAQEAFQTPMNMSHGGRQGHQQHQQKMHDRSKGLMKALEFQRNTEERTEGISILA